MNREINHQATAATKARYDRIAPIYNLMESIMERFAFDNWRKLLWAQVKGALILEVGVGTGKNMPYWPPQTKITAIDLSAKMLQKAKLKASREGVRADLRQMDVQALDFSNDRFDSVVASFVFCSVPDPVRGFKELKRVTKPEGKIHLLEHLRPEGFWRGKLFDLINPVTVRLFGFNINRRTLDNIRKADLEIENVKDLDRNGIFKLITAVKSN